MDLVECLKIIMRHIKELFIIECVFKNNIVNVDISGELTQNE